VSDLETAWEAFDSWRQCGGPGLPHHQRMEIFEACGWRCCYCGVRLCPAHQPIPGEQIATVEHIRRRADGGSNERENLAASCPWCNHRRGHHDALVWFEQVQWLKERGKHPHFSGHCTRFVLMTPCPTWKANTSSVSRRGRAVPSG
jgi:hypothetical protein